MGWHMDDFSRRDIMFHRETAASYDEDVTATYGVYHRYLLKPYLDMVAGELGHDRALDLGCGTGVISLALAERGFDVLGVDHSREMLAIAEKKLVDRAPSGRYEFVVGDVRNVPADDEEFGCVTCQGLLHHLPEMESCLGELNRVLRPGGFFFISEPALEETPLKRSLRALWRIGQRGGPPPPEGPDSVEAPIKAADLRALLSDLGLEFEMEFLTHLPPLRSALPENFYLLAVRTASFPWRKKKGDLLFVFGRKATPKQATSGVSR
jgi:SAM-dependent methyltransferase